VSATRTAVRWLGKLPRLVGLLAFFVYELVLSSLRVAHDVVTPRDRNQPAIVSIPLDLESDLEIALLVNLVTLTPGTLALGLSSDRKAMLVHAMFAPDSEQLRREIKDGYERRVKELLA
jgi:multicomponent Na+:H+ antiporter subunit E